MTITPNSPINTDINFLININDSSFDPRLFFTDANNKFYYMLLRKEFDGVIKVVASGILQGHPNGINYDYRFDFTNYIKIDNQGTPVLTPFGYNSYTFSGTNSCPIYLCISSVNNMIDQNISNGNLQLLTNGEVILDGQVTPDELICSYYFEYNFVDKDTNNIGVNNVLLPTISIPNRGMLFPVTTNRYNIRVDVYANNTAIHNDFIKTGDYSCGLIYIHNDCTQVNIYALINNSYVLTYELSPKNTCNSPYYFFNKNGAFDALYCEGIANEVDSVERNTLQVGNKKIQTEISIIKQIKQNTGLKLTQEQVYSLISSPLVYKLNASIFKEYILDTNVFEGYNGKKVSEKNLELVFTDPKKYKRYTNANITFFD